MAVKDWSTTAASNVTVGGISIAEGCNPGNLNDSDRAIMADAKAKFNEIPSVTDYADHATADAAGAVRLYVPAAGITSTRANGDAVVTNHWGPGQVTTADGNKRGKWFSNVTARPTSLGNDSSVNTAFNGDLSKSIFQIEHRISGAATLSQPTTGYVYTPEAYPFYGFLYNSSGWNNGTGDNTGRTAAVFNRVHVYQAGQGDAVAYNFSGVITSTKVGATHFLANPAACGFNGEITAGVAGCYLNPFETELIDAGFDVAAAAYVANLNRTNATGALSACWLGVRIQSIGTVADRASSTSERITLGQTLAPTSARLR
jgi:hypothetical protein